MSLNDEQERLNTAEQYMLDYQSHSQEFEAAVEHVRWVYKNKPELAARCKQIMLNVAAKAEERREYGKVKELSK